MEPAPQPAAVSRVIIEFVQFPHQFFAPTDLPDAADEIVIWREEIPVAALQQRPQDSRFSVKTLLKDGSLVLIGMQAPLLADAFGEGPSRVVQGMDRIGAWKKILGAPRPPVPVARWRRRRRDLRKEIGKSVCSKHGRCKILGQDNIPPDE